MLFDTHMHCEFSCDSDMKLEQAVRTCAQQELGMIVTEHWDYDYPTNPTEFLFDIDKYFERFKDFRRDNVLCGIEVGMQRHTGEINDKLVSAHAFDFVLGSIHCIGGRDLYEFTCYDGRTRAEVVEEFLDDTICCLETHHNFDAFAHIDYICRYWPYKGAERELRIEDSPELYDKLFRLLIENNKPIEINTRRLGDKLAASALVPLYKHYGELGGRFCTLGSDAHHTDHIGRGLQTALTIARETGLIPVYFKERKMQRMVL